MANGPNLAGFNTFLRNVMAIDPLYLPDGSPVIGYSFDAAFTVVNPQLAVVSNASPDQSWTVYEMAVYNLAGSNLINFAQDQTGRAYFTDLRKNLGISNFQAGVVSSASDSGTSTSILTPEFLKNLTLQNIQAIKDPWGRMYLSFAQSAGTIWGLS